MTYEKNSTSLTPILLRSPAQAFEDSVCIASTVYVSKTLWHTDPIVVSAVDTTHISLPKDSLSDQDGTR